LQDLEAHLNSAKLDNKTRLKEVAQSLMNNHVMVARVKAALDAYLDREKDIEDRVS
jgi:hypothetical protein